MAEAVTVRLLGVDRFEEAVVAMLFRVEEHTGLGVHEAAKQVIEKQHSHMDGRPGPNRVTGNQYRSITSSPVQAVSGKWGRAIYPDGNAAPYARRIELGFYGADRRGRVYNQPPYPYFFPGLADAITSGVIQLAMSKQWAEAIR